MAELKTETVLAVQTRSFLASFEKAGGEETKVRPPLIIVSGEMSLRENNMFVFKELRSSALPCP